MGVCVVITCMLGVAVKWTLNVALRVVSHVNTSRLWCVTLPSRACWWVWRRIGLLACFITLRSGSFWQHFSCQRRGLPLQNEALELAVVCYINLFFLHVGCGQLAAQQHRTLASWLVLQLGALALAIIVELMLRHEVYETARAPVLDVYDRLLFFCACFLRLLWVFGTKLSGECLKFTACC